VDGTLDETRLERLEEEIERQEASIVELRRRTHTLEVEVAAWPAPRGIRGPFQVAAERSRALEEAFLGLVSGWLLAMFFATFWLGGRL
jgi:hypothetical protein